MKRESEADRLLWLAGQLEAFFCRLTRCRDAWSTMHRLAVWTFDLLSYLAFEQGSEAKLHQHPKAPAPARKRTQMCLACICMHHQSAQLSELEARFCMLSM